jgi:hypothetical protein
LGQGGTLERLLACHIVVAAVQELLFTLPPSSLPADEQRSVEFALVSLRQAVALDPGRHHLIAHLLWLQRRVAAVAAAAAAAARHAAPSPSLAAAVAVMGEELPTVESLREECRAIGAAIALMGREVFMFTPLSALLTQAQLEDELRQIAAELDAVELPAAEPCSSQWWGCGGGRQLGVELALCVCVLTGMVLYCWRQVVGWSPRTENADGRDSGD